MHLSCFCSKGSSVSRHTFFLYVLSHIFTTYQNNVKSTSVPHDFTKTTEVQLEGPALVPSFNSTSSKETLLRRHVKHYNHQVGFLVGFEDIFRSFFCKKCTQIGSQMFFGVYVFWLRIGVFFSNIQVNKFSPSPKTLGRWIFLIQSRGEGNSSNLKTLACPTRLFPGHHEGEYVQSFCNWLACAEVHGLGCQRTRRNKGGMAQSWKS